MVTYTYKGVTSKDLDIKYKQIYHELKKFYDGLTPEEFKERLRAAGFELIEGVPGKIIFEEEDWEGLMDCLKAKCKFYHIEYSKARDCNYCDVLTACILDKCPVDSMVRYTADRLDGLKRIKEYLEGIGCSR